VCGVKPLLSVAHAAELLGIDAARLRQLIDLGHLPAYAVAQQVKLRPEHIDAYLRSSVGGRLRP
jgi:excisionase family DNA binding protein